MQADKDYVEYAIFTFLMRIYQISSYENTDMKS